MRYIQRTGVVHRVVKISRTRYCDGRVFRVVINHRVIDLSIN